MISTVAKKMRVSTITDIGLLHTLKTAFIINTPIALLVTYFACNWCMDWLSYLVYFLVSSLYGLGLFLGLSYWNNYLGTKLSWLGSPWKSFWIALFSNILVIIITVYIVNFIYRPFLYDCSISCTIKSLEVGEFIIPLVIGLMITAIFQAANFLNVWKISLVEAEKYKNAQLAAQYETLTSQVNPHFLFNSLNVLSSLVKKDPEKAESFIQQLSNVYRNILDVRNEELISIQQELKTLKAYLFLIETRFGERIRIDIQIDPKEDEYLVPLSFQMLVENAVKHNVSTIKNPLTIQLYSENNSWWVKNNRKQMMDPVAGNGMGLENIRQRYQLATGKEIIVQEDADFFTVGLPIIRD